MPTGSKKKTTENGTSREKKKRKKNARINFSVDKMKGIGNRCVCFINEEREWCEQQRKIKTKFAVYRLLSREKEGTR